MRLCQVLSDAPPIQQELWSDQPPKTSHTGQQNSPVSLASQKNFIPIADTTRDRYQRRSTVRIMRQAACHAQPAIASYQVHLGGGANRSLTNDDTKLINYRSIKRHAIAGIAEEGPVLYATGIGYLPWRAADGTMLLVKCIHSPQAAETIISPQDIVANHISDYTGWTQHSDVDSGKGSLEFHHRNSNTVPSFDLEAHNGLWYNYVIGLPTSPSAAQWTTITSNPSVLFGA